MFSEIVDLLTQKRFVTYIEPQMIFKFNNKHASSTVQSGVNSVNQQTIWNKGITGAGQIVGCGDSGIDMSHSFFYDSHFNTPISTTNKLTRSV